MPRMPLFYPLSRRTPHPALFPSVFAYTIDNANSTWTEHAEPQYVQSGEETRIYFAAINDFEHDHDVEPPSSPYSSDTNPFGNSRFSHPPAAERRKLKRNRDRNYTPCRGCKSKKVRVRRFSLIHRRVLITNARSFNSSTHSIRHIASANFIFSVYLV